MLEMRTKLWILATVGAASLATATPSVADEAPKAEIKPSGTVRFNYALASWDSDEPRRERGGDLAFDTIQLGMDGSYGAFSVSGGYRFYQGYSMLHHGYVAYQASDNVQVTVGLQQVPFGILPFASHSWFFDLPYYFGLEDDYDIGIRVNADLGKLDLRFGFYKNSEGTFTGGTIDSARYSYDLVRTTPDELGYAGLTEPVNNIEANQFNIRAAYDLEFGPSFKGELGASFQIGGVYNLDTEKYGYHWAAAGHFNGNVGPLNVHLQGLAYRYELENPDGARDDVVVMGAYDAPYFVAAAAYALSANVQYTLPVDIKLRDVDVSISVYENFSMLIKDESDWENTIQNVVGALIAAGPIYLYVDLVSGLHHPWFGPGGGYGAGLAEGRFNADGTPDDSWHTRFNINLGYYF